MSITRLSRDRKRQLGQFLTPEHVAAEIVKGLNVSPTDRVLEPSFGEGAFVFALLAALTERFSRDAAADWSRDHLFGCEIDEIAYNAFRRRWPSLGLGPVPANLERADFFTWLPPGIDRERAVERRRYFTAPLAQFDLIIGNPPFGGSINPALQDALDAIFGQRGGRKIKKETYAFFIVKCVDLLKPGGRLVFICSDTLLTIPTMTGLRAWLMSTCNVQVSAVPGAFADTNQEMVLLTLTRQPHAPRRITVLGSELSPAEIEATPNRSWRVGGDLARYFTGATVGDKLIASSGMTIGNNELFLRPIETGGLIYEPYDFALADEPITMAKEIARARLGKVPPRRLQSVALQEAHGDTEKVVTWRQLARPCAITLPHPDYRYYNKATAAIVYHPPEWVIFWRNDGEYVYTFKKTGNWYLHGVGGQKYFGREGLTWSLIAPRLYPRYLPPGYILDTGAPCAFLRDGVAADELYFILGWALTDLCSRILKEVLNHTRNIQSKDFERLPYPGWVDGARKQQAIAAVKELVFAAQAGRQLTFEDADVRALNQLYHWPENDSQPIPPRPAAHRQLELL